MTVGVDYHRRLQTVFFQDQIAFDIEGRLIRQASFYIEADSHWLGFASRRIGVFFYGMPAGILRFVEIFTRFWAKTLSLKNVTITRIVEIIGGKGFFLTKKGFW